MSLIVEVAGMFAGMLAEYATSRKWSKVKVFFVSSTGFFLLFLVYTIIFPSPKGMLVGVLVGAGLGIVLGLIFVIFIHLKSTSRNRNLIKNTKI